MLQIKWWIYTLTRKGAKSGTSRKKENRKVKSEKKKKKKKKNVKRMQGYIKCEKHTIYQLIF